MEKYFLRGEKKSQEEKKVWQEVKTRDFHQGAGPLCPETPPLTLSHLASFRPEKANDCQVEQWLALLVPHRQRQEGALGGAGTPPPVSRPWL